MKDTTKTLVQQGHTPSCAYNLLYGDGICECDAPSVLTTKSPRRKRREQESGF